MRLSKQNIPKHVIVEEGVVYKAEKEGQPDTNLSANIYLMHRVKPGDEICKLGELEQKAVAFHIPVTTGLNLALIRAEAVAMAYALQSNAEMFGYEVIVETTDVPPPQKPANLDEFFSKPKENSYIDKKIIYDKYSSFNKPLNSNLRDYEFPTFRPAALPVSLDVTVTVYWQRDQARG
jgi:hypothetical protein